MDVTHETARYARRSWWLARRGLFFLTFAAAATSYCSEAYPPTIHSQMKSSSAVTKARISYIETYFGTVPIRQMECGWGHEAFLNITSDSDNRFFISCGYVRIDGKDATFEHAGESNFRQYSDRSSVTSGPPDSIVSDITVLRAESKDEELKIRSKFAYATFNGTRLMVRPDGVWRKKQDGGCPADLAMIADRTDAFMCGEMLYPMQPQDEGAVITLRHWDSEIPCGLRVSTGPVGTKRYFFLQGPDWPPTELRKRSGAATEEPDPDPNPDDPCLTNSAESIEFEKVPSATTILLTDDPACNKEDPQSSETNFWIELKTTQKSVTFSKLNLDEFFSYAPGDIVQPGLRLIKFYRKSGAIAVRNLSCVEVVTSSAPPTM